MKRSLPVQSTVLTSLPWLSWLLAWLGGALLIGALYQIPARHTVRVGLNDAAYVQGFSDPVNRWGVRDPASQSDAPLRWAGPQSALIFPQIGLPATATIRWRAVGPAGTQVRVLLNGRDELGVFTPGSDWQTETFTINGGLLKPNDVFLALQTEAPQLDGDTMRGLQVAQATLSTSGWPVLPYPAQLLYGAAAVGLGVLLVRGRRQQYLVALATGLAFLLLYRLPLTPYPLRALPPLLALTLGAALLVRTVPHIGWRAGRVLLRWLALGAGLLWLGWLLQTAQQHVVLSVPGVEKDFRVFATRAEALLCDPAVERATAGCVLRADGFYQLGYPLLLWLARPLTDQNAFRAAQLVGALSGALLLGGTWLMGRRLYGRGPALLALVILALSPLVVQYGLYLGTDMTFAALWMAGLAALLVPQTHAGRSRPVWTALLAGVLCALAFLIRHPGLVLLPFGWIALIVLESSSLSRSTRGWISTIRGAPALRLCGWFTLGWLVAALPQLAVNIADTGAPLYSQQAKNIWLAVYGNTDWSRWDEASNDVRLSALVLADPPRFWGNWSRNLQAFVGTGANDTSEFGQALALRLLAFPANWLALTGLTLWFWHGGRRERLLVAGMALYVLGVSIGFVLPRFFLPLAPVWALASVAPLVTLASLAARRWPRWSQPQWLAVSALALLALLARGPQIGARYVLDHQDPHATAVVRALLPRLAPSDRIAFALPAEDSLGKYSALAHYATRTDLATARYVIWSAQAGEHPALDTLGVQQRAPFAVFGPYQVYAIE